MNKLIDNTETNHSSNLIAKIQSKSPQSNYERIAQQFVNLVDMAKNQKPAHHQEFVPMTNPNRQRPNRKKQRPQRAMAPARRNQVTRLHHRTSMGTPIILS